MAISRAEKETERDCGITLANCQPGSDSHQPVTVLAKHHVRPDKLEVFQQWSREMEAKCSSFQGYIDTEIIRPTCIESDDEYVVIFRFDNYTHLQAWMNSTERKRMIDRISEFASSKSQCYSYHSLEHWFAAADDDDDTAALTTTTTGKSGGGPPARYKMVFVVTGVIYAQTLFVPNIMNQVAPKVDPDVKGFLVTLVIVTLSTYIFFPIVTRLLAFWLFPTAKYTDKLLELVRVPDVLRQKFLAFDATKADDNKTDKVMASTEHMDEQSLESSPV